MNIKVVSAFLILTFVMGIFAMSTPGYSVANGTEVIPSAILTTSRPVDSVPDHNGSNFFFTSTGPGMKGIFRVSARGGSSTPLTVGTPLVEPRGITIGSDDFQLYVTDPEVSDQGAIWVIPVAGGQPVILQGSLGTKPQGVTLVKEQGQDWIYFTGIDPINDVPGVFKLPAAGGKAPSVIAEGGPLVSPDGVAVNRHGTVFVSDGQGAIFRIDNGRISTLVDKVLTGTPAGIALSENEQVLLVSALTPDVTHAQILLVNLKTLTATSLTQVVSQNPGAGGLHRALNGRIFSWCGIRGSSSGIVYQVSL